MNSQIIMIIFRIKCNKVENRPCGNSSCPVPGFIIAGGWRDKRLSSTEEFNSKTGQSCPTGEIRKSIRESTFCNNFLCGGKPSYKSCEKFDGISAFEELPVILGERRNKHLCWGLPSGEVLLLGGEESPTSTELVSADGTSSSASFTLPYDTW